MGLAHKALKERNRELLEQLGDEFWESMPGLSSKYVLRNSIHSKDYQICLQSSFNHQKHLKISTGVHSLSPRISTVAGLD